MGIASRREAEKWISEGRLAVNGKKVSALGTKVNPESDQVFLDGRAVKSKLPPKVYWLLHKPDKVLTARSDELTNKPTIYDIPMVAKAEFLVSPVGRLDFRTEGLLLLTNDGELSYRLCRPEYHVPREYHVLLDGRLTKEEEQQVKQGVHLEDGPVKNVKITYAHGANMGVSTGAWYMVTVHEGRNRLVRRLFENFNRRVVRLIRVAFGEIRLPLDLPAGEYRQLTADQVSTLRKATEHPVDRQESRAKVSSSGKRALRKPLSQRPDRPAHKALSPAARKPKSEQSKAEKSTVHKSTAQKSTAQKSTAQKSTTQKSTTQKPTGHSKQTAKGSNQKSAHKQGPKSVSKPSGVKSNSNSKSNVKSNVKSNAKSTVKPMSKQQSASKQTQKKSGHKPGGKRG